MTPRDAIRHLYRQSTSGMVIAPHLSQYRARLACYYAYAWLMEALDE